MSIRTRYLVIAAALFAMPAGAQELATYGAFSLGGLGEGAAILGTSISSANMGWGPIAGVNVQSYRFRLNDAGNNTATNTAFAPSVGVQYRTPTSTVSGSVGYNFTSSNTSGFPFGISTGGDRSVFVTGQALQYGGNTESGEIVSYNFGSQYVWSRVRAAARAGASNMFVGGEVVAQGTSKSSPSAYRFQAGPTVNFHVTPDFHFGGSAGVRTGNNSQPTTGYAQVEFLLLTHDLFK